MYITDLKNPCYKSGVSVWWAQAMFLIGIFESKEILQDFLFWKDFLLLSLEIAKNISIKGKSNIFAILFSRLNKKKWRAKKEELSKASLA